MGVGEAAVEAAVVAIHRRQRRKASRGSVSFFVRFVSRGLVSIAACCDLVWGDTVQTLENVQAKDLEKGRTRRHGRRLDGGRGAFGSVFFEETTDEC